MPVEVMNLIMHTQVESGTPVNSGTPPAAGSNASGGDAGGGGDCGCGSGESPGMEKPSLKKVTRQIRSAFEARNER